MDDYSLARVLIVITDENDNAPVFQSKHYYAGKKGTTFIMYRCIIIIII